MLHGLLHYRIVAKMTFYLCPPPCCLTYVMDRRVGIL
jgi:hypothetical protein